MSTKFLKLVENQITRYSNGGLLAGDVVVFAKDYKSRDSFKALSKEMQSHIEAFMKTDKNIRVADIKTMFPSRAPGDSVNRANSFSVELAIELAPGLLDLNNKISVPGDLVVADNDYINLPKVPDSVKKKEKINHKPVAPEEAEESPFNPYMQTLMAQDGGKVSRTDSKLLNKNVTIPSETAKGARSPEVKGFSKMI